MNRLALSLLAPALLLLLPSAQAQPSPAEAPARAMVRARVRQPAPGATWAALPAFEGGAPSGLCAQGKALHAAADYELFRSSDGGATWTPRLPPSDGEIGSLACTAEAVWVTAGGRLFKSVEDGAWEEVPICAGLPEAKDEDGAPIACEIKGAFASPRTLVVDAGSGLFRQDGTEWTRIGSSNSFSNGVAVDGESAFFQGAATSSLLLAVRGKDVSAAQPPAQYLSGMVLSGKTLAVMGANGEGQGAESGIGRPRLFVSQDGGKRWSQRSNPKRKATAGEPAESVDFEAIFARAGALYGFVNDQVFVSRDFAKSWRPAYPGVGRPFALVFVKESPVVAVAEGILRWDPKAKAWIAGKGFRAAEPERMVAAGDSLFAVTGKTVYRCSAEQCDSFLQEVEGFWAAEDGALFVKDAQGLRLSLDAGTTWTRSDLPPYLSPHKVVGRKGGYATLSFSEGVWRSPDGVAWRAAPELKDQSPAQLLWREGELFVGWHSKAGCVERLSAGSGRASLARCAEDDLLVDLQLESRTLYGLTAKGFWRSVLQDGRWGPTRPMPRPSEGRLDRLVVTGSQLWAFGRQELHTSIDRGESWKPVEVVGLQGIQGVAVVGGQLWALSQRGLSGSCLYRLPLVETEVEVPAEEPATLPKPPPPPPPPPAPEPAPQPAKPSGPVVLKLKVLGKELELPEGSEWKAGVVYEPSKADVLRHGDRLSMHLIPMSKRECVRSIKEVELESRKAPSGFEESFDGYKVFAQGWGRLASNWQWFLCVRAGGEDYLLMVDGMEEKDFGGAQNAAELRTMLEALSKTMER